MFDLRYHVASLAAVFFALVIGILVGVALASHGLGNTERDRLQEDLRRAQNQIDLRNAELDARIEANKADAEFVKQTYSVVMADRLKGKKIAVLFVGKVDPDLQSSIGQALEDAGSDQTLRMRALEVPINEGALAKRLAKRPFLAAYAGEENLDKLGQALGQEFVAGKDTPLWSALQSAIVGETHGPSKPPADGVVVARTVEAQMGPTADFLAGVYKGLRDIGIPVVGVEASDDGESAMKAFQKAKFSTVDNVDQRVGKLALVILLSDSLEKGDFGTKDTADHVLPTIRLITTTTTGG
jgi:hypothetical protein